MREPAEAGSFYPSDPKELRDEVKRALAAQKRVTQHPVRAVLVPHAGFVYSASVAAASFAQLEPGFTRVVVIAGNHNGEARFDGASVDRVSAYRVPGQEVKLASAASDLAKKPGFVDAPAAHTMHMVEIELPFVAEVNRPAPYELVPIIVGRLSPDGARELAKTLSDLADAKTRFVFSVDLSHYYTAAEAERLDRSCLAALETMEPDQVASCDTDATQVLTVMTHLAALQGWSPKLITYKHSGDVSGDRDRVVGYGALVYEDVLRLTKAEQDALLELARRAVDAKVRGESAPSTEKLAARFPRLAVPRATFVTLKKEGALRGCIGSLVADEPLAASVVHSAGSAAVSDSRFERVRPAELPLLEIAVSVLEPMRPLAATPEALVKKLAAEHPGLVISYENDRSVFLPEVWEDLPEPTDFLGHLCRKQGAPEQCWRSPKARFETFGSQHLGPSPAPAGKTR